MIPLSPVENAIQNLQKIENITLIETKIIANAIVSVLLNSDSNRRLNNDYIEEKNFFEVLSKTGSFEHLEKNEIRDYVFQIWVRNSVNPFAIAYRLGYKKSINETVNRNVQRAAKGRRLIGASSRQKVRDKAELFRHLSKEAASFEISNSVGLTAGTIRRYLSELFPGNEW